MTLTEIIAQIFGILGLAFFVISFQIKGNKGLFAFQALSGLMFFANYALIGALSGALFNLTNLIRGTLFSKNSHKKWHLALIIALYTSCFAISLSFILNDGFQIFLSSITYLSLIIMSVLMWLGNSKHIRYGQILASSPAWIVHNIFNFTLGGLLCEFFAITSSIISLIRFRKSF